MSPKLKAALVGAIVAIVVGFAASQGLISQQTAEEIKAKTNEVLAEEPAPAPTQTPQPQTNEPQPQAQQQ
ncbi:hypothetical protein BRY73_01340 [Ochrobactrum sp. P6BS-III]|jgi:hypothetical protein|uniref:hypothetical protein n=1 Tax=unclassified Ochrobactrum TaxID=239106 RepID=UPI000992AFF3|nr:hypothetical protein [Ochrobactrum sp. P6BSIII]OOL20596.1 hypothetical protein BRY73_01340 [Ochrobactrum sp. P6BS-III]